MSSIHTHAILFSSCAAILAAAAGCMTETTIDGGGAGGRTASSSESGQTTTTSTSASTTGSGGAAGGCTKDADCPPTGKPCQLAACQADGTCAVVNAAQGTLLPSAQQVLHDCKALACDGSGAVIAVADDQDIEDDGEICTIDTCSMGSAVHAPAAGNTDCSAEGPAPATVCGDPGGPNAGKCVECNDASGGAQCASKVCQMNTCVAASCMDGVQNGSETDVDCGGPGCSACSSGKACVSSADCQTSYCIGGSCGYATSCNDLKGMGGVMSSGVYTISVGGTTLQVYCDMTNDGGGWTMVMNQTANSLLPFDTADVNQGSFGLTTASWRIGNPTILAIAPAVAWKLTDASNSVYFKPSCHVDYTHDYINDKAATDCTTGYKSTAFNDPWNGGWVFVSAAGIGINNFGQICSMRAFFTESLPMWPKGAALPCDLSTPQTVSLWYK